MRRTIYIARADILMKGSENLLLLSSAFLQRAQEFFRISTLTIVFSRSKVCGHFS